MGEIQDFSSRRGPLQHSLSTSSVGPFAKLILENLQSSLAPRTWNSYSTAWRDWVDFCASFHVSHLHSDIDFMLCYLATLFSKNISHSGICKNLAGIAFFQKMYGITPFNKHFLVLQSLKGYRRRRPTVDGRRPLTFDILIALFNILPIICTSIFETSLFRSAFNLAFFGA